MAEIDITDLEIKGMRLDLVDLISPHVPAFKECIPYLNMYESELEALVKLPDAERRKEIIAIAHKVLSSYKRDKDGGQNAIKRGK